MIPEGYQYQTPIIRESIEKGRNEGLTEGRALEKALSVIEVFEAREVSISEEQRARILACSELDTLTQWLKRAITVASVDELFTQ